MPPKYPPFSEKAGGVIEYGIDKHTGEDWWSTNTHYYEKKTKQWRPKISMDSIMKEPARVRSLSERKRKIKLATLRTKGLYKPPVTTDQYMNTRRIFRSFAPYDVASNCAAEAGRDLETRYRILMRDNPNLKIVQEKNYTARGRFHFDKKTKTVLHRTQKGEFKRVILRFFQSIQRAQKKKHFVFLDLGFEGHQHGVLYNPYTHVLEWIDVNSEWNDKLVNAFIKMADKIISLSVSKGSINDNPPRQFTVVKIPMELKPGISLHNEFRAEATDFRKKYKKNPKAGQVYENFHVYDEFMNAGWCTSLTDMILEFRVQNRKIKLKDVAAEFIFKIRGFHQELKKTKLPEFENLGRTLITMYRSHNNRIFKSNPDKTERILLTSNNLSPVEELLSKKPKFLRDMFSRYSPHSVQKKSILVNSLTKMLTSKT